MHSIPADDATSDASGQVRSEVATTQRWYAVWTRSRHEAVVHQQLEGKQIEAFLPTVTKWSRWQDRKKKIAWPLFPGRSHVVIATFEPLRGKETVEVLGWQKRVLAVCG